MKSKDTVMSRTGVVLFLVLVCGLPQLTAGQTPRARVFTARLATVPVSSPVPTIVGSGVATAMLTGSKLTISGTFHGLNSAATIAQIHKSPKPGIRGPVQFELVIAKSTSGTITGAFDLTATQVQELSQGRYYIQLHSEKAPDGNLWGWLLSEENPR